MVCEELVVDEWHAEAVGNDRDDAFGLLAVWRFGDICLKAVDLDLLAKRCAIVFVALYWLNMKNEFVVGNPYAEAV